MSEANKFQWAGKVSRRDIRRLYESDAQGLLDRDLLDKVMFTIQARVSDMFEVRQAQTFGRVRCRACGSLIPELLRMRSTNKDNPLVCSGCGWRTTCGEFMASYTGKDMLPGSRKELFEEFLERFPSARLPEEKILLLDWLIHEFHVQSGVSRRLVAMNIIQGSREQLVQLLSTLAAREGGQTAKKTWLAEQNNPIRHFRQRYPSHAKVLEIAGKLGIQGKSKKPENELIAEILHLAPELND